MPSLSVFPEGEPCNPMRMPNIQTQAQPQNGERATQCPKLRSKPGFPKHQLMPTRWGSKLEKKFVDQAKLLSSFTHFKSVASVTPVFFSPFAMPSVFSGLLKCTFNGCQL